MKKLVFLAIVLTLAVLLSGFVGVQQTETKPIEVTVTLQEYKVVLSRTNLPAGVPIQFTMKDMGSVVHEAVLEKAGTVDEPIELEGKEAEVEDIHPGEVHSVTWTIDEPGEYQLACHIAGHFEGGMVGLFSIRQGGEFVSLLYEYAPWILGAAGVIALVIVGTLVALRRKASTAAG
jgi:uncharacterized cupredoxin-like copper-binding protein